MFELLPYSIADSKLICRELGPKIIYKGHFKIESVGKTIELNGEILYFIYPKPMVSFKAEIIKGNTSPFNNGLEWKLTTSSGITGIFNISSFDMKYMKGINEYGISGTLLYELTIKKPHKVKEIKFSILNFVNNQGHPCRSENRLYMSKTVIKHKEYHIELDKVQDSKTTFETLKNQGGFNITHIGQISREDGESFELSEIDYLIENLMWIFSFVAGRQVDINHIYSEREDVVTIYYYRVPRISEWRNVANWYPENSVLALEKIVSSFLGLMEDEYWKAQLPILYSSYFDSLGPSYTENKIIIIQTALETLCYAYLVETTGELSNKNFESKAFYTSKKIAILLKKFNIDDSLNEIQSLQKFIKKYSNGPSLYTSVRNDIVHPKQKMSKLDNDELYYVWRMGITYFELILLAIADYSGEYQNMLPEFSFKLNRVQQVPWTEQMM